MGEVSECPPSHLSALAYLGRQTHRQIGLDGLLERTMVSDPLPHLKERRERHLNGPMSSSAALISGCPVTTGQLCGGCPAATAETEHGVAL